MKRYLLFCLIAINVFKAIGQDAYPTQVINGQNLAADVFSREHGEIISRVPNLRRLLIQFGTSKWSWSCNPSVAAATLSIHMEMNPANYQGFEMRMPDGIVRQVSISEMNQKLGLNRSANKCFSISDIQIDVLFRSIGAKGQGHIDYSASNCGIRSSSSNVKMISDQSLVSNLVNKMYRENGNQYSSVSQIFRALDAQATVISTGGFASNNTSYESQFYLNDIKRYIDLIYAEHAKKNQNTPAQSSSSGWNSQPSTNGNQSATYTNSSQNQQGNSNSDKQQVDAHNNAIRQQANQIYENSQKILDMAQQGSQNFQRMIDQGRQAQQEEEEDYAEIARRKREREMADYLEDDISFDDDAGSIEEQYYQKKAEEREYQQKETNYRVRWAIVNKYPKGSLPDASLSLSNDRLYYFFYANYYGIDETKELHLSSVYSISRYPDGTWPLPSIVYTEMKKVVPKLSLYFIGHFATENEAVKARETFKYEMAGTGLQIIDVAFKGFNTEVIPKTSTNYWGGTINKLKYEEAEQKYLKGDYSGAIGLLQELEQNGIKNPSVAHLKLLSISKLPSPDFQLVSSLKKELNTYLSKYDLPGFEAKFRDIYELSKTLNSDKYNEAKLAVKEAFKYYNAKDYTNARSWFLKANGYGNPDTDIDVGFYMGYMYHQGHGLDKNRTEALKWYIKAANKGHSSAQNNIGVIYQYGGDGIDIDINKAIEWYTKAANQGMKHAQNSLGDIYSKGLAGDYNYPEAIKWYTKAAEQGVENAQYRLGEIYFNGYGGKDKTDEATEWYTKAANQGNKDAQTRLGDIYASGRGSVRKDLAKAIEWHKKSEAAGVSLAQISLLKCYIEVDETQALYWFNKIQSNPSLSTAYKSLAFGYLGAAYHHSTGYGQWKSVLPKDLDKAIDLYKKQNGIEENPKVYDLMAQAYAEKGDQQTALELLDMMLEKYLDYPYPAMFKTRGDVYFKFNNVEQGIANYQKAIDQGVPGSKFELAIWLEKTGNYQQAFELYNPIEVGKMGYYYYDGKTVGQDFNRAAQLWEDYASKIAFGNLLLAVPYFTGKGKPKDRDKAVELVKKFKQAYPDTNILEGYKEDQEHNRKHFPTYAKDEEAMLKWLEKEYMIRLDQPLPTRQVMKKEDFKPKSGFGDAFMKKN